MRRSTVAIVAVSRACTHHPLRLDLRSFLSLGPPAVGMAATRNAPWIMYVALLVQGVSTATSMMVSEGIHRDIDPYNASRTSDSMKEVHEVQEVSGMPAQRSAGYLSYSLGGVSHCCTCGWNGWWTSATITEPITEIK
eukprot:6528204-Pyramimonas_sp.AAC.1